jgi:hypothetical protein
MTVCRCAHSSAAVAPHRASAGPAGRALERPAPFAATIGGAVAEPHGEVRSVGVIPSQPESIRKPLKKLGS